MIHAPFTRRALLLASFSGLMLFAAPRLCAVDRVTPGQYELTVTNDGKTATFTRCVTPAEAKLANADAKTARKSAEEAVKGDCTITAYEDTGERVSFTMVCDATVSTMIITYHGDTYESKNTRTVGGVTHTTHIKAKRVGACK